MPSTMKTITLLQAALSVFGLTMIIRFQTFVEATSSIATYGNYEASSVIDAIGSSTILIANPSKRKFYNSDGADEGEDAVLVVAAVDGTLAGIHRLTGDLIWRKEPSLPTTSNNGRVASSSGHMPSAEAFLRPLLSTTTTSKSASTSEYAAVPSIDGNVFLTGAETVRTSVKELVQRAPFLDPNGRFYVGRQHTTAAAFDLRTGEILSIMDQHQEARGEKHTYVPNVLWIGRTDYSVTVQDSRTGQPNVQFSVSEIKPVKDLAVEENYGGELPSEHRLVVTPSGTLAMVAANGKVQWVMEQPFSSPIAFGICESGLLEVDVVSDATFPTSSDVSYLSRELEKQIQLLDAYGEDEGSTLQEDQTLVGRMDGSGQLYAIPLGKRQSSSFSSTAIPHSSQHAAAVASFTKHTHIPKLTGILTLSHSNDESKKLCHPASSHFPSCLVDQHKHQPARIEYFAQSSDERFLSESLPPDTAQALVSATSSKSPEKKQETEPMVYHPDYGYIKFTPRPKSRFTRIMRSWLPATIALIFVLSFEVGRRKRLQDLKDEIHLSKAADESLQTSTANVIPTASAMPMAKQDQHQQQQHVIQVSDEVLGYGGQGTVVYKGVLDGREVAVKRMLQAYHASADREIRLLIESDGHPNVVRYFLKEVRGDFVYLALELCDLSLHDLIGILREDSSQSSNSFLSATKIVLRQIASGVQHLHSLRIAHRDLKPANILLATNKQKKKYGNPLSTFIQGSYVAKISDMGLGKQILGQSSVGGSLMSPRIQGQSKGAASSVGIGPGTVGWQAPEVMATRWLSSDASTKSGESSTPFTTETPPPIEMPTGNPRTSRSVDIFSLGCIFYSTLVPGFHPFGEWYEREANIVHNRPSIEALAEISPNAYEMVKAMINRDPKLRPSAKQICDHPFFWTSSKKLSFFCEVSDRLETDTTVTTSIQLIGSLIIERGAVHVVGTSWDAQLDEPLISNMQRFRTYDPSSIRDLLRLIRNKHHHFEELPEDFRASKVANQDALLEYFEEKFPALLMHCWNCCRSTLTFEDPLMQKYDIPGRLQEETSSSKLAQIAQVVAPESLVVRAESRIQAEEFLESEQDISVFETELANEVIETNQLGPRDTSLTSTTDPSTISLKLDDVNDVIAWVGSTTAKELKCRGWNRSDSEWARRIDPDYRRRDQALERGAFEDPKFRTRLCNHWDESMGLTCKMRRKNKCIFAHGPVELRVKEAKKNRWGKLVDDNGNFGNPWHSGGEDTYGAARSIEKTRKTAGKWNTDKEGTPSKPSKPRSNRKKRPSPLVT